MNVNRDAQKMHKDFFDRCKCSIDNEFYMEAILMEYAAIESRLEVMLGLVGMPCNKFMDAEKRKDVKISDRISCINKIRVKSPLFEKSKLPSNFFANLKKWVERRNRYVHGLYKNEIEYSSRIKGAKEMAEKGFDYARLLYNEANRLKRYKKSHLTDYENSISTIKCPKSGCKFKI